MSKELHLLEKIERLESELKQYRDMQVSLNNMFNDYLTSEARQCESECGPWYEYYKDQQNAA